MVSMATVNVILEHGVYMQYEIGNISPVTYPRPLNFVLCESLSSASYLIKSLIIVGLHLHFLLMLLLFIKISLIHIQQKSLVIYISDYMVI